MKRYYIRFKFRNTGWSGVVTFKDGRWQHTNGQRGAPVEMSEQRALDGLRSTAVKGLRFLAQNECDDLEICLVEQGKGVIRRKRYYSGALSQLADAIGAIA